MSDLYTDEGTLDYAAAVADLRGARHITNDLKRGQAVDLVGAAALVDIAVSLNAIVTALATGGVWLDEPERPVGPDGEPMGDEEREGDEPVDETPLEVGDWVARRVDVEEGEPAFYLIEAIGTTEGADYAVLPELGKVWVADLVRIETPASLLPESSIDADDDDDDDDAPTGVDLVDDIDSDFDAPTNVEPVKPPKTKGKGKNKSKGGE